MVNLSILIPTHNRKELLFKLLESINQFQEDLRSIKIKTLVINDGSTDGTSKMLEKFQNVGELKGTGDWWFTRCINEGAFEANRSGDLDFFLIINDDCILDKSFFLTLSEYFKLEFASRSIIGPITLTEEKPRRIISAGVKEIKPWLKRILYAPQFQYYSKINFKGIKTSRVLSGRGMLIPSEIFFKLGGFETKLKQYHSDEEFCLRAQRYGYQCLINMDWKIYNYHEMTSKITSYKKTRLIDLIRSFFDKHSRNYFKDRALIIWRYQNKFLFPFLFTLQYILILRSALKKP